MIDEPDARRYPARPLLAASCACFRDGKVLLARRGQEPWKGVWSLPGGMVELGERASDAAVRELFEETGVRASIVGLVDLVEAIRADDRGDVERHVAILAFAGLWSEGEPVPGPEAEEIEWVEPAAVALRRTTDRLGEIVEKAARLVA